ncbi:Glycosyltransferase involved in cell wall bisynthesis [Natronincola peptidivorans]|uniref:Glycosyltransferase involved in cell wall bisynthesis n=1 Tax=Natronincola peptidivorans TaxID=426128 RepID=A0A1H9YN53_9FIRM|nr:glycosyltransferase family 2 protein [Natronincola peptidivorans]SES70481.1 Glycosyltransferase involved in cell wall bisynthesis [Natronincola peptidivorans]
MKKRISAIIPVFNEEKKIEETLLEIKKIDVISKIYVVNDGSTDNTAEITSKINGIVLINCLSNNGKGAALKMGVKIALEESDIIIFLDGDLGKTVREANKLLEPIISNTTDVTIAKFPPAKKKGGLGFVKKLAKYGVYYYTGKKLDTVLSGQRAFKKSVLKSISLDYRGFEVELGMTIEILKKGFIIKEVDVNMVHNETGRDLQGFIHRGKQFKAILYKLLTLKTSL